MLLRLPPPPIPPSLPHRTNPNPILLRRSTAASAALCRPQLHPMISQNLADSLGRLLVLLPGEMRRKLESHPELPGPMEAVWTSAAAPSPASPPATSPSPSAPSPPTTTTPLPRDIDRMLAGDCKKRVIIVDTSNEIGGDGDIPYAGLGSGLPVPNSDMQHKMICLLDNNHCLILRWFTLLDKSLLTRERKKSFLSMPSLCARNYFTCC